MATRTIPNPRQLNQMRASANHKRASRTPPPEVGGLAPLQDSVRPFPSDQAKRIIQEDLRVSSLSEVFVVLTPEPIASASLGQVSLVSLRCVFVLLNCRTFVLSEIVTVCLVVFLTIDP